MEPTIFPKSVARICIIDPKSFLLNENIYSKISEIFSKKESISEDNIYEIITLIKSSENKLLSETLSILKSNKFLRNAIFNSSDSLLSNVDKYLLGSRDHNKKFRQAYESAFYFINRASFRTIPLSTFTEIASCSLIDDIDFSTPFVQKNNNLSFAFYKQMNSFLYDYVFSQIELINEVRKINKYFINDLAFKKNDKYIFYVSKGKVDGFHILQTNELINNFIDRYGRQKISYTEIQDYFKEFTSGNDEEIDCYIQKLIDWGILISDYRNIDLYKDINSILIKRIKDIHISGFDDIIKGLENIKREIQSTDLLNESNIYQAYKYFNSFKPIFNDHQIDNKNILKRNIIDFPLKTWNIIYGDFASNREINISKEKVNTIIKILNNYLRELRLFNENQVYKTLIKNIFNKYYNENEKVPFIQFYYTYREHINKEENELDKLLESQKIIENKWISILGKSLEQFYDKQNDTVNISINDLIETNKYLDVANNIEQGKSYSAFIQYVTINNRNSVSIESILNGYGRAISRYFQLPGQDAKELKLYNENCSNEEIAEVIDHNYFNINIHPALTNSEINISTNVSMNSNTYKIGLNDLLVCCDSNVYLLDEKRKRKIIPVNLGLQVNSQRSRVFDFLQKFSNNTDITFLPLVMACTNLKRKTNKDLIIIYPRIILDKNIVIRRKCWKINTSLFDVEKLKDEKYFCTKWLEIIREYNLPFYGTLRSDNDEELGFIEILNPLYRNRLIKFFKNNKDVILVELLPDIKDFPVFDNKQRNTELIITWYN